MPHFVLRVLDDGSTDESAEVARAIRDPRIEVSSSPVHGVGAVLDRALASVASPFVARMDADDIADPRRFEVQLRAFEEGPELVIVGSAATLIDSSGQYVGSQRVPISDRAIRTRLPRANPFLHPTVMIRTDALRRAGGYDTRFPRCEDYATWVRLLTLGKGANLDAPLVTRRVFGEGISFRRDRETLLDTAHMRFTAVREGHLPARALIYAALVLGWAALPGWARSRSRRQRFRREGEEEGERHRAR